MNKLLHKGSVKDLYELNQNEILFEFSNRYSIFDWGEMPDQIPEKGNALAKFSKDLYKKLESEKFWQDYLESNHEVAQKLKSEGLKTHLINKDVKANEMIVRRVPNPKNDYSFYESRPKECFIPLEVIYRLGVPTGSSLLKRYPDRFSEGELFDRPMLEFSTKWENIDRVLTRQEAQSMFYLSHEEILELEKYTECLALACHNFFKAKGLRLWDGKIEWAYIEKSNQRQLMLVDSIGPDELRISFEGIDLSKEVLRSAYKNSHWYKELVRAKENFGADFKSHCSKPSKLDPRLIDRFSKLYQLLGESIESYPDFSPIIKELKEIT